MIDKIINEWTYQLDAGYPTKESDYEILRSVLQETNMLSEQEIDRTILQAKGVNEDEEDTNNINFQGGAPTYDDAIRSRLGLEPEQSIPRVKGNYVLNAGPLKVLPEDGEMMKKLWAETTDLAIIGKGEIAVYWLFQYQNPSKPTTDTRGEDAPDLNIDGKSVEVKSEPSHFKQIGLGRFASFKESNRMISLLFGLQTLTNLFSQDKKVYSLNAFGAKELEESFESLIRFDNIADKELLIEQFPVIFKPIYQQIDELKSKLGLESGFEARAGAAEMFRRLVEEKFSNKPGQGGFIINVNSKDPSDLYTFEIDIEGIKIDTMLKSVVVNGAAIKVNYYELFGKEG